LLYLTITDSPHYFNLKSMKKYFLLSLSVLQFISISAQDNRSKITGARSMKTLMKQRFDNEQEAKAIKTSTSLSNAESITTAKSTVAVTVTKISNSINAFGVLNPNQRPLSWNDNINGISFIHRQGPFYNAVGANPSGKSGTMIAMLSSNFGTSWDSTCIWVNNINRGRYPQGGLYSAPGNVNYNNAYVVGTGVTTDGSNWTGGWYASKSVTATPKNAPGADQQFFSNTGPFTPPMGQVDFPSYGFSITDDGAMRSVGGIYADVNNNQGYRGAQVVKGVFNAGAFIWSSDSIIPPALIESNGERSLWNEAHMAWNEQGTIGYVVFIGSRIGQTGSNKGWQPIVYKTTNSGSSWALVPSIDFNLPAMQIVKNRISAINLNPALKIPFFNVSDGYDITVDANGYLHLGTTVMSSFSQNNDSLSFNSEFGADQTRWTYKNGSFPYIYDFATNGSAGWQVFTVDTMQTESPGALSGTGGFTVNPFTLDAFGEKVSSGNRLQLSRSVIGDRIAFVWADSDTNLTGTKYNIYPDLKARLFCPAPSIAANSAATSLNRVEITKNIPANSINNLVKSKSYFNYVSPKMRFDAANSRYDLPLTVSNNASLDQDITMEHYFIKGEVPLSNCIFNSISENKSTTTSTFDFQLVPNPASNAVKIISNASGMDGVSICTITGQVIMSISKPEFSNGELQIETSKLNAGIYFITIKQHSTSISKKLIIE
jgi:hypothetical protein